MQGLKCWQSLLSSEQMSRNMSRMLGLWSCCSGKLHVACTCTAGPGVSARAREHLPWSSRLLGLQAYRLRML